jgi:predicted nucleotidyltransferase
MIFPINSSKYEILKCIYENPGVKISDLLRLTNTSQKIGYGHIRNLLKAGIISETLEGKKPILRTLRPNFSEAGKTCFALMEIQKRMDFFGRHPELKGSFLQFDKEIRDSVDTVLLFGSFARGTETNTSDIDIAVLAKTAMKAELEKTSERCFVTSRNRVSMRLLGTKEFIGAARKGDEFIKQIAKDHIVVSNADKWTGILSQISGQP